MMYSASKASGMVQDLHRLVRDGDVEGILEMERKCAPAEWERAMCGRDKADLTPFASACTAWNVDVAKALLSLGSARTIFVRGFQPAEIRCTLPYVGVVPENHLPLRGSGPAEETQHVLELAASGKERETEALKDAIDSSLAKYIQDLAAGTLTVSQDNDDDGLLRDDASASKASTTGQVVRVSLPPSPCPSVRNVRTTMCAGDLVRLKPGLFGSTVLISQRGTDNHAASVACLGAESEKRLGLVISANDDNLVVASLSSGHVCEYHQQDLIFADGTSLASGEKKEDASAGASRQKTPGWRVGDLVTFASGALGTAAPSLVDDPTSTPTDKSVGCCVVTTTNYMRGLQVVRGPDWDWGDEDGGEGGVGVMNADDVSDGWVTVTWGKASQSSPKSSSVFGGGGSSFSPSSRDQLQYRLSAADLKYHKHSCVCASGWRPTKSIDEAKERTAVRILADETELQVRMNRRAPGTMSIVGYRSGLAGKQGTIVQESQGIAAVSFDNGGSCHFPWDALLVWKKVGDDEGAQASADLPSEQAVPGWLPASDQILVVSSRFHEGSSRGLVVSRLDDASQQVLARASDLRVARFPDKTYTFKRGEMVRLQPSALACQTKCLGSPADNRRGCVVYAGTGACNGFQRNIEVAVIQDGAEQGGLAVSLYSALDLAPASLYDYTGTPSEGEAQMLVDKLSELGKATNVPLQANALVDMFGLGVWDRLWAFFVYHGVYAAAFAAFCEFQKSRPLPALDLRYRQLLERRRKQEPAAAEALDSAVRFWSTTADVERVVEGCAATWTCGKCKTGNPADCKRCQVCASLMPSFKCGSCLQANAIIRDLCSHCLAPNPASAPSAHAASSAPPLLVREGAVCDFGNDVGRVLMDDVLFMDDAGAFDASAPARGAEASPDAAHSSGHKSDAAAEGGAGDSADTGADGAELLFGYRVEIDSEGELRGKRGRVIALMTDGSPDTAPVDARELEKTVDLKEQERKIMEPAAPAFSIGDVVRVKSSFVFGGRSHTIGLSPDFGGQFVVEEVGPMVAARSSDTSVVTKFFPFSLEKVQDSEGASAPAPAPAPADTKPATAASVPEPTKEGCAQGPLDACADEQAKAYLCEIWEDGQSRCVTLKREQLKVLSSQPSNLPLDESATEGEQQERQAVHTPWQLGALVRVDGDKDQIGLAAGRRTASVGCISSLDLKNNSVRVAVTHGLERRVSNRGFKAGDIVRLCPQYTSIGDAAAGPMVPGQRGSILACREGLALVQAAESVSTESQKEINNRWWYEPDALVHAEPSPGLADKKSLALDKVMRSSSNNCGVFFDIANTSKKAIRITGIVAGGQGPPRGATLYACGNGAPLPCRGLETTSSSWRKVGAGHLQDKKSSTLMLDESMVLQPAQVQGFLLHSARDGVDQFKVGDNVQLAEGYEKVSDAASGPLSPNDVGVILHIDPPPSGFGGGGFGSPFGPPPPFGGAVPTPPGAFGASVPSRSVHVQFKKGGMTRTWHYQTPALKHAGGVRCSRAERSFSNGDVQVMPWHATNSSSPHDQDFQSRHKCCLAGEILYQVADGYDDTAEIDLKHLRIVHAEQQQSVPVVVLKEFISNIRKHETTRQTCRAASASAPSAAALTAAASTDEEGYSEPRVDDAPDFPEDEADMNARMLQKARCHRGDEDEEAADALEGSPPGGDGEDSTTLCGSGSDIFQGLAQFKDLVGGRDEAGNTVAHHLAMADMTKSLEALVSQAREVRWLANEALESPLMICDGFRRPTKSQAILHRAIHEGGLLQADTSSAPGSQDQAPAHLVRRALLCAVDYTVPRQVVKALEQGKELMDRPGTMPISEHLFSALQMVQGALSFSAKQVHRAIRAYLKQASVDELEEPISPVLYLVRFMLYQKQGSKSRVDARRQACALAALECFPAFAAQFLSDSDRAGSSTLEASCLQEEEEGEDDDDDEDSIMDAASEEWKTAKADHKLVSSAMDQLMGLTGLTDIKKKAMGIVKEVLLQKVRPKSVKADTSMNFLFTGNPGCGKTTVARLIAKAMSELGFRSNPQMVETSAQDILKLKDPASEFAQMLEGGKGGTIFIDEAYRFSPASGAGSQPNASNQVLDYLLEAVEKPEIRKSTTVILAGYSDEIEDLLAYNVGFSSRFPLEFAFEDYSERQLRQIFTGMVKDRGMRLESKKACGVSISSVMAARIHQGAGKKGFGNARAVRNKLEQVISAQSQRIGTRKLRKLEVTEADLQTLTALDALGPRPNFAQCQPMREMEAMVGLGSVKAEFRRLVSLSQQNYDREMRGDKPERLSLHRVFFGNPGTGKTTIAKMYGALLKELGLLSKGDFISVTPADLTGDAEGGAATNTKAILERAKGKVLFIDEAYVLDPRRKNNQYGGNVLDTLVEKLDGEAGSDIAVILAGYKQEMFDMLDNNAGLRRRFNIDDFGIHFTDFSDEELKAVLVSMAAKCGLVFDDLELVDAVISVVGQKRRLPGFGNAGTVASMLNLAKAAKAGRLGEAQQALEDARRQGLPLPPMPDPDVLIRRDFIPKEEADPATAREAFAHLYNTEHIVQVLDKLEALIVTAKEDGREAADVLSDSHMVFVGPPGTGKTTVAQSFGKLFKDLKILPSDNVTTVTGTSLMGQYVGETKEKVLKAMHQARGGILFIDEAYGISGSSHGSSSFGREAIDTLVGSMTSEEFKGNLLVIMAGYERQMDALFANANPGFASRFNKKRIVFKPWTAQQAAEAVVAEVEKSGKSMTAEAQALLLAHCRQLQPLPLWGSARDVFETILPNLYTERAGRLYGLARSNQGGSGKTARAAPYEAQDVEAALHPVIDSRRKMALEQDAAASFSGRPDADSSVPVKGALHGGGGLDGEGAGDGANSCDSADGMCSQKPKLQVKHRIRRIDEHEEADEDGEEDFDICAALELACRELGYTEERVAEFLGDDQDYPAELLERIMSITSCNDVAKVRSMLDRQKGALLTRMLAVIEYKKKVKSEEEARCQQALREMGRCPMDYEWLKEEGGWRCAGGSHYVSDDDIASLMTCRTCK